MGALFVESHGECEEGEEREDGAGEDVAEYGSGVGLCGGAGGGDDGDDDRDDDDRPGEPDCFVLCPLVGGSAAAAAGE